ASPERLPDLARQLRPDMIFLDERLRAAREGDRIASLKLDPATCDLPVVLVAAGRRGPEPGLAAEPDERLPRHFGRLDVQAALALREVVANAIEWGHRNQPDRLVRVLCRFEADRVTLVVRDNGPGFDRRNLTHAARADDPLAHLEVRQALRLREGGFGILMAS